MDFIFPPPATVSLPVKGQDSLFPVRRIYCVGRNYLEHIREMKESDERDPPFFFQKPRDAILQSGRPMPYPPLTQDLHYEAELVLAIGKQGAQIPVDQALDFVLGYAVGLDMTRRDRQRESGKKGHPWEIGKSFDASAPCGSISLAQEIGHLHKAGIRLYVNGEVRQNANIEHLIWKVPEIVHQLSMQMTLVPGDLIFTGTPAGVGAVVPGDRIVAEIDGLSSLSIEVIAPEHGL